jgi:glutamyl-tRNA reductase
VALVYLGTDFHETSLRELERFEAATDAILASLNTDSSTLDGVVLLATCNRFEIYFEAESFHDSLDFVTARVAEAVGRAPEDVSSGLQVLFGESVPAHLFSVASGLESMIIGEEEIAGQVKRSLSRAQRLGQSSKTLNQLFQTASSAAKSVTTETGLGASGRSVITTALEIAEEHTGGLGGKQALLIGTGAYSRVVASALEKLGLDEVFVYSRAGRAEKFSSTHHTTPIDSASLVETMAQVELVVSASGSTGYAIEEEIALMVSQHRADKSPLVLIDVALSKDVAPEVSLISGMTVIDLEEIKTRAPQEHIESLATAKSIIDQCVTEFHERLTARSIDPVVSALRAHVGIWVDAEIESVRSRSGDAAAQEVQRSLRKVANAILHTPSVKAKELAIDGNQQEYVQAVRLLFDIEVNDGA